MSIAPELVMSRANELYRELKQKKGQFIIPYSEMPSDQIKALCTALCEAINKELQELP